MTVWKEKDRASWRYEFQYKGETYRGSTGQLTREDAVEFEEELKRKTRRAAGGLSVLPEHSPRISAWAGVYMAYLKQRGKVRRLEAVDDLIRVVLRFWGARPSGRDPKNPPIDGEPYRDLRLVEPVQNPELIEAFEQWIAARGVGAQTRLHYMSVLSRMYRVAMLPKFAKKTGVTSNPFLTVERDRPRGRTVTVSPAELRAWLGAAPKHTQLAMAIAALAPKLRLENVLALRWDRSFIGDLEYITVAEHKTVGTTGAPLVTPVQKTLRTILKAAQREARGPWVVTYRGGRVKSIRGGLQRAAVDAGILYGRDVGGVTFHTLRHTAATLLAEVSSLTEAQRAATMGQDIETTQKYTHLRPTSQRRVLAHLGQKLRLEQLLATAFRPGREPGVLPAGAPRKRPEKPRMAKAALRRPIARSRPKTRA